MKGWEGKKASAHKTITLVAKGKIRGSLCAATQLLRVLPLHQFTGIGMGAEQRDRPRFVAPLP